MNVNPDSDAMIHFCHRDDILQCYLFLMFYYLVCQTTETDENSPIFPNWSKFVELDARRGTESKVSNKFRSFWGKMVKFAEKYIKDGIVNDEINEELIEQYCLDQMSEMQSSHGGKKRGVQDCADADLAPQVRPINNLPLKYFEMKYFSSKLRLD